MTQIVTKTFSGTGNSDAIIAKEVRIGMSINTATLNVQWQLDGTNWRTIDTYTASEEIVVDANRVPVRVNCSAFTTSASCVMRGSAGERVDVIAAA